MKPKAIIFGCGDRGRRYIEKVKIYFDVVAFADNNRALWGNLLFGKPVISPDRIKEFGETTVCVCVEKFWGIVRQLSDMGIDCIVIDSGLFYTYKDMVLYPVSYSRHAPYRKSREEFAVLYVQNAPCGRTDKISRTLKAKGVMTQNAFFLAPSKMPEAYCKENVFDSYDSLLEFVNNSEFDIVHCSNEPDILANLLIHSNKPAVVDTHDVMTVRDIEAISETYYLEYAANKFADGNLYVAPYYRDLQIARCGIPLERTFVLPNLVLEGQIPAPGKRPPKLSASDGELHVVYEGGISSDPASHRFFEDIWGPITASHVHIHYYSPNSADYCRALEKKSTYLHYEGDLYGQKLIAELGKYDIGSLLLNPVDQNAMMASPNKLYEYLAAGLPIVTNLTAPLEFVTSRGIGGGLDFKGNVQEQLKELAAITVPDHYLQKNKLTMDSRAEDILAYYKKISRMGKTKIR